MNDTNARNIAWPNTGLHFNHSAKHMYSSIRDMVLIEYSAVPVVNPTGTTTTSNTHPLLFLPLPHIEYERFPMHNRSPTDFPNGSRKRVGNNRCIVNVFLFAVGTLVFFFPSMISINKRFVFTSVSYGVPAQRALLLRRH